MGHSRERWRRQILAAGCLLGLLAGGIHFGQGARAFPSRTERLNDAQLAGLVERLDGSFQRKAEFRSAMFDLYRRVSAAEHLQDLRLEHPEWRLPKLSSDALQRSYAQAAELARDEKAVSLLQGIGERYQAAVAFTAAEEANPGPSVAAVLK